MSDRNDEYKTIRIKTEDGVIEEEFHLPTTPIKIVDMEALCAWESDVFIDKDGLVYRRIRLSEQDKVRSPKYDVIEAMGSLEHDFTQITHGMVIAIENRTSRSFTKNYKDAIEVKSYLTYTNRSVREVTDEPIHNFIKRLILPHPYYKGPRKK